MIKLFRNIRKNLVVEGKTARYFKYAIGEIVLVMVGILLALQVNNWNEQRIRSNEELTIMKALKVGLETDLSDLTFNTVRISSSIASANIIIQALENDEPYRDSIADYFGDMMFPVKFVYSTSAFETLKSKGIGLIRNATIRDEIVSVYDSGYTFFLRNETIISDETERGFKFIFPTRFEESYVFSLDKKNYEPRLVPLNYDALKKDQEFKYYIKTYKNRLMVLLHYQYNNLIMPKVQNLINSLEGEITSLEN